MFRLFIFVLLAALAFPASAQGKTELNRAVRACLDADLGEAYCIHQHAGTQVSKADIATAKVHLRDLGRARCGNADRAYVKRCLRSYAIEEPLLTAITEDVHARHVHYRKLIVFSAFLVLLGVSIRAILKAHPVPRKPQKIPGF